MPPRSEAEPSEVPEPERERQGRRPRSEPKAPKAEGRGRRKAGPCKTGEREARLG